MFSLITHNSSLISNLIAAYRNPEFRNSREYYFWWHRDTKVKYNLDVNFRKKVSSDLKIDIVIPAIDKDLDVLPYTIKYARQNIKHKIDKIFIVSPLNNKIKELCFNLNCEFVDETSILGYSKDIIKYNHLGNDRSGWLFQQLVKLYSDNFTNNSHILLLDSDTLIIRPKKYEHKGKLIFDFSNEYHLPYYKTYEKLTGLKHSSPVSFVSHYMLLEANKLKALRKHLEDNNLMKWDQAIINNIDQNENSFFSEYETYSNYVLSKFNQDYIINYWFNKSLLRNELEAITDRINLYSKENLSLSFHSYNQ